jgi:TonB family protein
MKNSHSHKCLFPFFTVIILFAFLFSFTSKVQASQSKTTQQNYNLQDNLNSPKDSVYNFVEKMPQYPGGEIEVIKFLSQAMRYPEEALKKGDNGKVIVQFVISKTGKVENAKVLRGVSPELDNEALRVIGLLPDWTPGEQNGEKVAVYRIIPVLFKKISPEDAWEVNEKTVVVIDNVKMPANFNINILNIDKFSTVTVLKPFPDKVKSKIISKYGKPAENGVVILTSNKNEIRYSASDTTLNPVKNLDPNCQESLSLPTYPGGETKLLGYIADSIQYPFVAKRLNTEGKVYVQFEVDTLGKVSNAKVVRAADYFLNKEAVRVVNTLPNWIPGSLCNKKLNFLVIVPVTFKLNLPVTIKKDWERNDKTVIMLDDARLPNTFQLEWLRYENLSSYKVLQPTTKEVIKQLEHQYGHDAANGVILIGTGNKKQTDK